MDFQFLKPTTEPNSCQAQFCAWDGLNNLCSAQLSEYFQRPVFVEAFAMAHSGTWSMKMIDTPLTRKELDSLLNSLQISGSNWTADKQKRFSVWVLPQPIGFRLAAKALAFPAEVAHAVRDGVWFTSWAAKYVVSVIRQRMDGRDMELYHSCYLIDRSRVSEPSVETCEKYLRKVVGDFLLTEAGKRAYKETHYDFNWGDVENEIPDCFLASYGVARYSDSSDACRFLCCGAFSILVNQDELLGGGDPEEEI